MQSFQRALAIQERLVRDHPDEPENQRDLSITYIGLGKVPRALKQPAEALKNWQHAAHLIESLREPGLYDEYNLATAYALSSTVVGKDQARSKLDGELRPRSSSTKPLTRCVGQSPPVGARPTKWKRMATSSRCGRARNSRSSSRVFESIVQNNESRRGLLCDGIRRSTQDR